jgi:hypothetical protein
MKKYLLTILIAVVLFSGTAFSQGLTLTKVGEWGSAPYLDVFVQGDYAYCAAGSGGLDIINIAALSNPVKAGNCDTPGYAMGVHVSGNYAYVADENGGLRIIDISAPSSPTPVGNVQATNVYGVFVKDNYAYLAAGDLYVIDISNPASPSQTAVFNTSGSFYGLWIKGNYAYLMDHTTGFQIVDISTPASPSPVGTFTSSHPYNADYEDIYVKGNYVYLAHIAAGLEIIDVSNPAAPIEAGTYVPSIGANGVYVSGNYAYVTVPDTGLEVIDITNPAAANRVGHVDIPDAKRVLVSGNYAYTAAGESGLYIIDVSLPSSPTQTGSFDESGYMRGVYVNGNYAYTTGYMGSLNQIDVSLPQSPALVGDYTAFGNARGVDIVGNTAYIASCDGNFYIVDISDPAAPTQVGTANPTVGCLTDVQVNGNYAYILSAYNGLRVYDISNPASPVKVGSYSFSPVNAYATIRDLSVGGNYVYIAAEGYRLYIIDVSNPATPFLAKRYDTPGQVLAVKVIGNYAYVALGGDGLLILDVSVPTAPTQVGSYNTDGEAFDVYVNGNYAFIADYKSGVAAIDISNPASPTLAASYDTPGTAEGVYAAGNYVYTADGDTGKMIILAAVDTTTTPQISLNRIELFFGAQRNGSSTNSQTVRIDNSGGGTLAWSAGGDQNWLICSPSSGSGSGEISVSVDTTGLTPGTYTGAVTVTDPVAVNSPRSVTVTLTVYGTGQSSAPFGVFATPTEETVRSSIPVTGWVLDDIGIRDVQLFMESGDSLAYIGDALPVEGARPDVEQAYPGYPMNYKAGWGYMMLTNFLPDGDGPYVIHAIATDLEGNRTTLGIKHITVDNANAVKPFGAIDTPAQNGTASGSTYRNQGWVLTPMPNAIPTDGSTIDVYVDGVNLGHPVYNIYREDIADLFPGYANSGGAHGYLDFDTTAYDNGVHTISWSVTDDAGNTDGIGSRYFIIQNTGNRMANPAWSLGENDLDGLPVDYSSPVDIIKGYNRHVEPLDTYYPNDSGIIAVEIKELERIEIRLFPAGTAVLAPLPIGFHGYQMVGNQLRPLPIGSLLDSERGIFYWQPGPGFMGRYRLVFIESDDDGYTAKKIMDLIINPRSFKE